MMDLRGGSDRNYYLATTINNRNFPSAVESLSVSIPVNTSSCSHNYCDGYICQSINCHSEKYVS